MELRAAGDGATVVLVGPIRPDRLPVRVPANRSREVALPAGRALRMTDVASFDAQRMYLFHIGDRYMALVCRPRQVGAAEDVRRTCSRLARSVKLPQPSRQFPSVSPRVRRQATKALQTYAAAREEGKKAIEQAGTHAAAAEAAANVASAATKAAKAISTKELVPLRGSLEGTAKSWTQAAEAAQAGAGFHEAGQEVEKAEKRIAAARQRLLDLGFRSR